MRALPHAIRAWTAPSLPKRNTRAKVRPSVPTALPRHALVIDTETTVDATQRLLFGAYRYLTRRDATPLRKGGWDCVAEGLIYADDLPSRDPEAFALLENYARTRRADIAFDAGLTHEPDWQLGLVSRTEFAEDWWHRLSVPTRYRPDPAVLVFFNAPFDISRLASGVAPARRDMLGGFSFQVMADADGTRIPYRPDVAVKQIDSKRALKKNRAVETGQSRIPNYAGHYLDLRTGVFALTAKSHTLASACKAYGLAAKTDVELGVVTTAAINYCRNDVALTAELFAAAVEDFETHPIGLQLTKAYSPASVAKSYLEAMGITPLLGPSGAGAATPGWMLGTSMSAFYGGRAECHIRLTPVPVVLVDFTSMYPTVNALMKSWRLITAETIKITDDPGNTQRIQTLVDRLDADAMFDLTVWPELLTLVEIAPDGDVLPVRATYCEGEWSIGVNYFADHHDTHWYAVGDVIASKILTGKTPTILRALTFQPEGEADGLKCVALRGEVEVDPSVDDFFVTVIEQRQIRKHDHGDDDPVQASLKVLANSGSYGIYAELTAQDHAAKVALHTGDAQATPRVLKVQRPEEPGRYCYPPLAACITAAARLMLALLEIEVTRAGGQWAFCDTDSMAIVATPDGGDLIACDGGPDTARRGRAAIRALSHRQVAEIRRKFDTLNPYDPQIVPDLLKEEKTGMCVAISAKRYALYRLTAVGDIEILKASEHGLGQFLNPDDPDAPVTKDETGCRPWIKRVWEAIIRSVISRTRLDLPDLFDIPAHARLTISSPRLLKPFTTWNAGRPYADQIKPANFMVAATIDPLGLPPGVDPGSIRLVSTYSRTASGTTQWINLYNPDAGAIPITTEWDCGANHAVRIKTYAQAVREYARHPEAKFLDHRGKPCDRTSRGLLHRDHITAERRVIIGKEANRIDEVEAGVLSADEATNVYDDGTETHLRQIVLPALDHLSDHQIARQVGSDHRNVGRIRREGQQPRLHLYLRLVELARDCRSLDLG